MAYPLGSNQEVPWDWAGGALGWELTLWVPTALTEGLGPPPHCMTLDTSPAQSHF